MKNKKKAYSTALDLKTADLRNLILDQHNTQQYILSVSQKVRLQYFSHLEKIKNQNAFSCKFQKISKGPPFHCEKLVD